MTLTPGGRASWLPHSLEARPQQGSADRHHHCAVDGHRCLWDGTRAQELAGLRHQQQGCDSHAEEPSGDRSHDERGQRGCCDPADENGCDHGGLHAVPTDGGEQGARRSHCHGDLCGVHRSDGDPGRHAPVEEERRDDGAPGADQPVGHPACGTAHRDRRGTSMIERGRGESGGQGATEAHKDPHADGQEQEGEHGSDAVAVDGGEHRRADYGTARPGDRQLKDEATINVAEPRVRRPARQPGRDLGQVHHRRGGSGTDTGTEQDRGRCGPEAHAQSTVDHRRSEAGEGYDQQIGHSP